MSTDAVVFLVKDDLHVQQLLRSELTSAGLQVDAYSSPRELLQTYDPNTPGCLLFDLWLPEMSGVELLAKTRALGGLHPCVVISGYGDVRKAFNTIQAGAEDCFEKPFALEALITGVNKAIEQDAKNRHDKPYMEMIRRRLDGFTPRDREVLELMLNGKLNKQIASDLGSCTKTVDIHRSHVLKKMHVRTVVQLMQLLKWPLPPM
jgi:FixJ family two-component response regulator